MDFNKHRFFTLNFIHWSFYPVRCFLVKIFHYGRYTWLSKIMYREQINEIKSSQHFGGSIFINVPSDSLLTPPPFVTGDPNPALRNYFLTLYKQDFKAVKYAIEQSNMFDSVKVGQVDSSLNYSTKYGYRYLVVSKGDGCWIIHDLFLDVNRVARDKTTGKGTLSVNGQGIKTRYWMLKKIAELTGAKKLHSGANKHLPEQLFTILDEQIQDGLFTIKFNTNVVSDY
jgi:hypothetical protein